MSNSWKNEYSRTVKRKSTRLAEGSLRRYLIRIHTHTRVFVCAYMYMCIFPIELFVRLETILKCKSNVNSRERQKWSQTTTEQQKNIYHEAPAWCTHARQSRCSAAAPEQARGKKPSQRQRSGRLLSRSTRDHLHRAKERRADARKDLTPNHEVSASFGSLNPDLTTRFSSPGYTSPIAS